MKRAIVMAVAALVFTLMASTDVCLAQSTFKIPFAFQAGGKKLPAGDYRIEAKGNEQITLRQEPGGSEVPITVLKTLPPPDKPTSEPQIIFNMVGNFEPSYTEYVTDYLLAEVWLPGQNGFLIHVTKGAHSRKTLTGAKAGK